MLHNFCTHSCIPQWGLGNKTTLASWCGGLVADYLADYRVYTTIQIAVHRLFLVVGNILLAAEVVVAIQHEDGSRVQGSFSPTTPLWEVVTHLEGGPVGGGPGEGGPVGGEQTEPVVVYTNQQVGRTLSVT